MAEKRLKERDFNCRVSRVSIRSVLNTLPFTGCELETLLLLFKTYSQIRTRCIEIINFGSLVHEKYETQ